MNSSISLNYPKSSYLLACSKGLERLSYYGIRATIVLYITSDIIQMNTREALGYFSWFSALILIAGIAGAALGDLKLGHKKAVYLGGILQAIGAFVLAGSSEVTLYAGMVLLVLGMGLYTPNFSALYGKQFRSKPRLLDSGFMMLAVAVNLGAMMGPFIIGILSDIDYSLAFTVAGVVMILSLIAFQISKPFTELEEVEAPEMSLANNNLVWWSLIGVSAFWAFYGLFSACNYKFQMQFGNLLHISKAQFSMISPTLFFFPLGVVAAIYWVKNYSSQIKKFKLAVGFTMSGLAILLFLSDTLNLFDLFIYVMAIILITIGEIFIAPILYSAITQFGNPKYLAVWMSLAVLPTRIFTVILGLAGSYWMDHPKMSLGVALTGLAVLLGLSNYLAKRWNDSENLNVEKP